MGDARDATSSGSPNAAARSVEVAARPPPVALVVVKTRIGEAATCAQISPGGADVRGGPDHNAGDQEGCVNGHDTARAGAGDRCGTVGGLSRRRPRTADSARAAPVVDAVPGAAPMAAARVASAAVPGTR
jgi:hypothetical protein